MARTKPVSVGVGGNDYCRATGSLLSRGKYEWPKRVWSHDYDRRHTLVVLLSFMIYDDRPRKGTQSGSSVPIYLRYLARLRTLRHFASFLRYKGRGASLFSIAVIDTTRLLKSLLFRWLRASERIQSIIYSITQSRESTRNDQRDCKIVSHEKSCVIVFLSQYLHVHRTFAYSPLHLMRLQKLAGENAGIDVTSPSYCKDLYPRFYGWMI